jgi:hypothetical protein
MSCGVEITLLVPEDKYPKVPSPCKELMSCGVEITLLVPEDKNPREPRPCSDENKAEDEMKVDGTEDR